MGEIKMFGFSKKNGHIFGDIMLLFLQLMKSYNKNGNFFPVQYFRQSQNPSIIFYIWGYMSGN